MAFDLILLCVGLAILAAAGEALVQGAARLARSLGISALVVGLTIVAFGTSAPELAVAVIACLSDAANPGSDALAVGNIVGSNVANILLVLGLAATICPIVVSLSVVRVDAPIMLGVSVAFATIAYATQVFERWHGAVLVAAMIGYTVLVFTLSKRESAEVVAEYEADLSGKASTRRMQYVGLLIVGVVGLTGGAELIVRGATGIAESFGLSKRLIGMTIVAIGTSLPEIATSVVAARRGHPDIAVGNVIGSNLFNLMSVLGIAALVAAPIDVPGDALKWDVPLMLLAAAVALPMMWTGRKITRVEGGALLGLYVVYLTGTIWLERGATG